MPSALVRHDPSPSPAPARALTRTPDRRGPATGHVDRRAESHRDAATLAVTARPRRKRPPVIIGGKPYTVFMRGTRFWIDFTDPVTGARCREPLHAPHAAQATTNRIEADRLADEHWNGRYAHAQRVAVGAARVEDASTAALVPRYLAWLLRQPVTDQHKLETARVLKRLLEVTAFGAIQDVAHISAPTIAALDDAMSLLYSPAKNHPDGAWTLGMRRNALLKVSAFLTYCKDELGFINANPCHRHRVFRGKMPRRPDDHFYDFAEVAALLDTAANGPVYAKTVGNYEELAICAYTGARIGEVLRLKPSHIDFARDLITIPSARKGANRHDAPTERTVRLWPALRIILARYFRAHRCEHWPLLFPDWRWMQRPGQSASPARRNAAPYAWLKSLCRRAGVPYRHGAHVMRHTYVSARLRMALPVATLTGTVEYVATPYDVVKREVGHSTTARNDTLTRIYTKAMALPPILSTTLDYHATAAQMRLTAITDTSRDAERRIDGPPSLMLLPPAGVSSAM